MHCKLVLISGIRFIIIIIGTESRVEIMPCSGSPTPSHSSAASESLIRPSSRPCGISPAPRRAALRYGSTPAARGERRYRDRPRSGAGIFPHLRVRACLGGAGANTADIYSATSGAPSPDARLVHGHDSHLWSVTCSRVSEIVSQTVTTVAG